MSYLCIFSFLYPYTQATQLYTQTEDEAQIINSQQNSWKVTVYPNMQNVPVKDIYNMRGGIK